LSEMLVFVFTAMDKHPQTGQALPVAPGAMLSFAVSVPGPDAGQLSAAQLQQYANYAMQLCRQNKWGTPDKCNYTLAVAPPNQPTLLCAYYGPPGAALSQANVQGGMSGGAPRGQVNQNRQAGPVDKSGFQELGDADLGGGHDNMFGPADDGTVSDIYQGGMGGVEVPRRA
jgi:hypothetical protein